MVEHPTLSSVLLFNLVVVAIEVAYLASFIKDFQQRVFVERNVF